MIPYRPVLEIRALVEENLLLFVGHHSILAWGRDGQAWESAKLSDEGVTITGIDWRNAARKGLGDEDRSRKVFCARSADRIASSLTLCWLLRLRVNPPRSTLSRNSDWLREQSLRTPRRCPRTPNPNWQ